MINFAPPSINPTDYDSLLGALNIAFNVFLRTIDDMLPAQVIAYDRAKNLAQVQPLISVVTTDDIVIKRAQIMSVPVQQIGGGGFGAFFPIRTGDLGFIKANDRDISLFKQSWTESTPNTTRKHSFSDAIFFPMVLNNFTILSQENDHFVLQSVNGSVRFSMANNHTCISDQPSYTQSSSAILDVQSTTKAFKYPAMTSAQKNAIPSPQAGFAVFDTTIGGVSVYNGSVWS